MKFLETCGNVVECAEGPGGIKDGRAVDVCAYIAFGEFKNDVRHPCKRVAGLRVRNAIVDCCDDAFEAAVTTGTAQVSFIEEGVSEVFYGLKRLVMLHSPSKVKSFQICFTVIGRLNSVSAREGAASG
jgi:hypothetical protein